MLPDSMIDLRKNRLTAWAVLLLFIGLMMPIFASPALAAESSSETLAIYEAGKKSYDAGDFLAARSKFLEAIKREPDNARWHYNLGLTLRQLDNIHAARQSLLKARELDPEYKRAEIDQKLASMGFGSSTGEGTSAAGSLSAAGSPTEEPIDESTVLWIVGGIFALVISFIGGVVWLIRRMGRHSTTAPDTLPNRSKRQNQKNTPPLEPPDPAAIHALNARLGKVSHQLIDLEHAMRLGEHPDLRSLLNHATQTESALRNHLEAALDGDGHAFRKANRALPDLESTTEKAVKLATRLHGDQAFAASGEKIACYFCARPLANPGFRQAIAIKRGTTRAEVVTCPPCAAIAARGDAPTILTDDAAIQHWSEMPGFDPYTARHQSMPGTQRLPAWKFTPQRSLGEIALMAGGAAIAGGALASLLHPGSAHAGTPADEALLDLDAVQETGMAQEAARAVAKRAAAQKSDSGSFADHS